MASDHGDARLVREAQALAAAIEACTARFGFDYATTALALDFVRLGLYVSAPQHTVEQHLAFADNAIRTLARSMGLLPKADRPATSSGIGAEVIPFKPKGG